MGFADMLYQLGIGYATYEGRKVAEEVMTCINQAGHNMSCKLAEEKGVFPNWEKSIFYQQGIKRRNVAITNVPPTGTISMMYDCSGGVEPYFALAYYYKNILGGNVQLSYVNKHLRTALESVGMYTPEIMDQIIKEGSVSKVTSLPEHVRKTFVTSMDISADDHILMQATFQKYCDNAISKTINFPNSATKDDILRGYIMAWEYGCKGCTVYRDGSRFEQVLNLNKDKEEKVNESTKESSKDINMEEIPKPKYVDNIEDKKSNEHVDDSVVVGKKRRVYAMYTKTPENCPDCSTLLTIQEGCCICHQCGYSKCAL